MILFLISSGNNIYCQTDTTAVMNTGKAKDSGKENPKHSLFAGAGFGSNMIYLGSTISENKPYYSAGLTYAYKNSFYLTASSSHLQGLNPFISFYNMAANYSHTFNSWFDISASFAGYRAMPSLQEKLFSNFVFANLTAGFDWKILYTKVSAGMVFSNDNRGYLQLSNSRYFQTKEFFKGKAYLSFDPEVNILFGDIIRIKSTSGGTRLSVPPPFRHLRKDLNPPIISSTTIFRPLDFEFSIPVSFNFNKLTIEAEPLYILPAYSKSVNPVPGGFTFFLSAYYRLF